ncbi:two-component sensor protein [Mycobacterium bohemicum DSM 44277]|uniref:histidine kinase n=3 Tax=Mycobacterium bohemicum TaxID=56425 RepID=A0A1X1R0G6_MYCBE|nr:histidine kinase [Mycobacterium bohemicum]CPR12005.1 two-component sensor protein [Mycobacterium bohemicum DSM 44277]
MSAVLDRLRPSQLTARGWQGVALFIMGAMVLAGAVVGAVLIRHTDQVARELIDNIQPARTAAGRLQSALRDQETGVRGYLIVEDRQFLTPYYDGQHAEQAAAEEVRRRIGQNEDLIADLDAIEEAGAQWRANYAEPAIASVDPGGRNLTNRPAAERGKAEFDHLRSLFDKQNANLRAARDRAADELRRTDAWRNRVLIAMVLLFFATAALLGLLVRDMVARPLAALAASCRRITEGDFDRTIVPPKRPRDIRDMAMDVENMRGRIVEELQTSRSAQQMLDEQALELRRSNTELEQFAYVASHDLQEPLRKVASFCQLLEKRYGDKLDERGIEYIGFAVDGAKRMQVLINDLLTFSRVGRLNTSESEVRLDEALDAALANLSAAIEESDAEIVRPAQPLPQIVGDPTLLTMLWQNLIGNAVKFRHKDRRPRVVVGCEAGDGEWLLSVADNGIGIPQEFADKVFVIFQRLHGRDVYSGTGVGLALVKKIVEHHGGSIRIDDSYTEGARIMFTIPMPASGDENHAGTAVLEGAQQQ